MSKCPDCEVVLAELERTRAERDQLKERMTLYEKDFMTRLDELEAKLRIERVREHGA